ncbi:MAG: TonB-dependent receptor [Rikenellaceae bacterium]
MLMGISEVQAQVVNAKTPQLSMKLENTTIANLLTQIEKQSSFAFVYSDDLKETLKQRVSISVYREHIEGILDKAFKGTDLAYTINAKQVVVSKKASNAAFNVATAPATNLKIIGTVVDKDGSPLIGVTVQEVGTNNIVVTDVDGNYTIYNVANYASVLNFAYIGCKTVDVLVGSKTAIDLTMEADATGMDEVVVVGYGVQKRESVVGAISTISPSSLQINQSRSVTNALAGQVSGIIAVQRSGEPGNDSSDFWIRGISSFGSGTDALVLVDGIERSMDNISPEEIESFSVLKDATATAIYGVRGANGVILIQTKKGKIGAPRVTVKADFGVSTPTQLPEFVDGATYMEAMNKASYLTDGSTMYTQAEIDATRNKTDTDLYPSVDWLDAVTNDYVPNSRVSLDVNGGSERLRYSLVASYYGEEGITVTDPTVDYDSSNTLTRYTMRTNLDMDLTKSTLLNVSVGGYITNLREPGYSSATDILYLAFKNTPIVHPTIYSNGEIPANTSQTNPWAAATNSGYRTSFQSSLQSVFSLTQDLGALCDPLDGFKAKAVFSFDSYAWNEFDRSKTTTTYMATGRDDDGNLITQISNEGDDYLGFSTDAGGNRTMYFETQISYSKLFDDLHQVDGLVLYNMQDYVNGDASSSIYSLPYRSQGLAGRISYSYDSRYFIESNFGYNGSENFSDGNKWGFFPSVAAGWLVTQEDFMQSYASTLSKLKIRASYGLVGNDQLDGRRFAFLSTIDSGTGYTYGSTGGQYYSGLYEGDFGVDDLSWETVYKTDIGLEIGLWNSLNIHADYFHERREDIFMERQTIPEIAGFNSNPWANFGIVTNQGFDGSLDYNKQINKDLFISVRGTFTYSHNEIIECDESESIKGTTRSETGNPVNSYYGLVAIGLFQEEDFKADGSLVDGIPEHNFGTVQPGDIRYADLDESGTVDAYDTTCIGDPYVPEIVYGFGVSAQYKNFDFSAFFQGATNSSMMIYGSMVIPGSGGGGLGNIFSNWEDSWNPDDPYAQVFWPRLSTNTSANNMQYSTWWLKDASYIRLKNLEIGYTLPSDLTKSMSMRNVRFFLRGSNLWTYSPFDLWDPELRSADGMSYPLMTVYSVGISATF